MAEAAALTFPSNIFQSGEGERRAAPEPSRQSRDLIIVSVLFYFPLVKQCTETACQTFVRKPGVRFNSAVENSKNGVRVCGPSASARGRRRVRPPLLPSLASPSERHQNIINTKQAWKSASCDVTKGTTPLLTTRDHLDLSFKFSLFF